MKTFDQLYFIDLHGSNKPKEFAPDGSKDENVFDIEQGVAISLLIKKKGLEKKIFHTDFWGTRIDKYKRSLEDEIKAIKWNSIEASAPFYLFQPQDEELKKKYNLCISIKDIFIKNSNGVVTKRDNLVIGYNNEEIKAKLKVFNDIKKSDEDIAEYFKIPLKDKDKWNLSSARKYLLKTGIINNKLTKIYYRPFDTRVIYFDEVLVARLVKNVMASLRGNNKAIICGRAGLNVNGDDWNLITVTNSPTDLNLFSRGGATIFPIYISPSNQVDDSSLLIPNFKLEFLKSLKFKPDFEELTGYIYSILHSPTYRKKYAEFLKIDFPRIPFTDDKKTFTQLAELGNQLIKVHLVEEETDYGYGEFIGTGNNVVEKPNYLMDKKVGKLYINKTQYFTNIPQHVYDFYIGGYQVLDKYLKDRKGRELDLLDVENIKSTAGALAFTIEQMKKIDTFTKNWI